MRKLTPQYDIDQHGLLTSHSPCPDANNSSNVPKIDDLTSCLPLCTHRHHNDGKGINTFALPLEMAKNHLRISSSATTATSESIPAP